MLQAAAPSDSHSHCATTRTQVKTFPQIAYTSLYVTKRIISTHPNAQNDMSDRRERAEERLRLLGANRERVDQSIIRLEQEAEEKKLELNELVAEKNELKEQAIELDANKTALTEELSGLEEDLGELNHEIFDLKESISDMQEEIGRRQDDMKNAR
jgi:chromosome segregation ATPase